jgi:hypothetical protein
MKAPRARRSVRAVRAAPCPPARYPWARFVAAAVLLGLVALKAAGPDEPAAGPGHRRSVLSLCSDPWLLPNAMMALGETAAALALCARAWRPIGAALGLLTMSAAALFAAYAGIARVELSGCGCFGPFDAPWHVHFAVAVAAAAPCALALANAPRPSALTRRCATGRAGRARRLPAAR